MPRTSLPKEALDRARVTLAALHGSPAIAGELAEHRSSKAARRRLIEAAGDDLIRATGGEFSRVAPFVAPVAAFRELRMRLRLARAETAAELAAVVGRSLDRSAADDEDDRRSVAFETASGERIVLRRLGADVWKSLVPGSVGILWWLRVRPATFVHYRELSPAGRAAAADGAAVTPRRRSSRA